MDFFPTGRDIPELRADSTVTVITVQGPQSCHDAGDENQVEGKALGTPASTYLGVRVRCGCRVLQGGAGFRYLLNTGERSTAVGHGHGGSQPADVQLGRRLVLHHGDYFPVSHRVMMRHDFSCQ